MEYKLLAECEIPLMKNVLEDFNITNLKNFINKAIGWGLRDPKWVKEFIKKYETKMGKLSIKEANILTKL